MESPEDKDSDLILLSPVYCLASPGATPKWKLVSIDHPGHKVERVESRSRGASISYLVHFKKSRTSRCSHEVPV